MHIKKFMPTIQISTHFTNPVPNVWVNKIKLYGRWINYTLVVGFMYLFYDNDLIEYYLLKWKYFYKVVFISNNRLQVDDCCSSQLQVGRGHDWSWL